MNPQGERWMRAAWISWMFLLASFYASGVLVIWLVERAALSKDEYMPYMLGWAIAGGAWLLFVVMYTLREEPLSVRRAKISIVFCSPVGAVAIVAYLLSHALHAARRHTAL
ncbi:MAG TPA: hypothetical protein VJC15_03575 [Candidatus Paceibacterota bacterium]